MVWLTDERRLALFPNDFSYFSINFYLSLRQLLSSHSHQKDVITKRIQKFAKMNVKTFVVETGNSMQTKGALTDAFRRET